MKKELSKVLAKEAKKKGICKEWYKELKNQTDRKAMAEMYLRGIDFCLNNNYPSNDFIKAEFGDIAPEVGVFVDSHIIVENKPKCVCLGATFGNIKTNGFNVCEAFAKHKSELNLIVADDAFVVIDVFDESFVQIYAHDRAKVCVNKYGDGSTVNVIERDADARVKIRVKKSNKY